MQKWSSLLLAALFMVIPLTACEAQGTSNQTGSGQGSQQATSRLDIVKNRGKLICGVEGGIPGFSYLDQDGNYSGIDVDICKAVATALFNDPEVVEYRNLDSTERFTALNSG